MESQLFPPSVGEKLEYYLLDAVLVGRNICYVVSTVNQPKLVELFALYSGFTSTFVIETKLSLRIDRFAQRDIVTLI